MTLDQDQAKHARDIEVQQSRRQHRTHEHCQAENILSNISTHHYSRDLLLNSLVCILFHNTHQTFIQRHLFTEPQLYQVKQVPREFDTRYSLTILYYLCNPVHLPAVEQILPSLHSSLTIKGCSSFHFLFFSSSHMSFICT